ncbi:MAG: four helix bundle protein [Parcubacteria group bacterium]|nr:four helix bundle protein [Parcubacteria group bacterium]
MQETITKQYPTTNSNNRRFDLEKRTTDFARAIIRLCKTLPRSPMHDRLVGQIVGSAGSVGANYREANDALGKKDFAHRLKIARKEAKETIHWLELIKEASPNVQEGADDLLGEATELKNILSAIIAKTK